MLPSLAFEKAREGKQSFLKNTPCSARSEGGEDAKATVNN
jgi:hypothetical protein